MEEYDVDRLARSVFNDCWSDDRKLGKFFEAEYAKHQVCQRCKHNPPEVIPYFSSYFAVCRKCLAEMEFEKEESCKGSEWD